MSKISVVSVQLNHYVDNDWVCTCVYREDGIDKAVSALYGAYGCLKHIITNILWADVPKEVKRRMREAVDAFYKV